MHNCTWKTVGAGSPTRSSATGPTHLERGQLIWKIQRKYQQLITLACSSPDLSGKVPAHRHKTKTKKKNKNIVGQPLNQLICNRANSCGKGPAHLENIKTKDKQLILWVGSSPNSSGKGPAHHLESTSSSENSKKYINETA